MAYRVCFCYASSVSLAMPIHYSISGHGDQSAFVIPIDVSFRRVLRLLSKVPGFTLTEKTSWPLTDAYQCRFHLGEHEFTIETPLSDDLDEPVKPRCPLEVFEAIKAAFDAPEPWWSRIW
jgi:hypothetical protein